MLSFKRTTMKHFIRVCHIAPITFIFYREQKKTMLSHNTMVKQRKQQASAIMKEIHGNGINKNSS